MSKSSSWVRKLLVGMVCINCCILIILCAIAAILTMQMNSPASPSTGGSSLTTASKPTTAPTDPTTDPTDPTTKPTDPTAKPTDPTTKPTDPTTKPTDPTTKPTDPTTKPIDPTTKPTDPTTKPTDPTTKPTEPTTQPTEPTTKPTEPSVPTEPAVPFDEEKFFSESVFIGDSVTLALRNYCNVNKSALHGAKILCAGSYAVRHAIGTVGGNNVVSITYQGQKMRPEDAIAACGAKRVFIMLGLNDIVFGIDWTMGNWKTLINNIRKKCPDIEIYIQSGTPIHSSKDWDNYCPNNATMDRYNERLKTFCEQNGCYYVDLAPHFKNENGDLADNYCSDPYSTSNPNGQGCHFSTAGVKLWIQLLKSFAAANHR